MSPQPLVDKTICPDHVPATVWEYYQNDRDDHGEPLPNDVKGAFERVIFSAGMDHAWMYLEKKVQEQMPGEDVTQGNDEAYLRSMRRQKFDNLTMHIRALSAIKHEDFSKMLTRGQTVALFDKAAKKGRGFLNALNKCCPNPMVNLEMGGVVKELEMLIDELEGESFWAKHESRTLEKIDIEDPKKTYMIRYFAGCLYTLFRPREPEERQVMAAELGYGSVIRHFINAILSEKIITNPVDDNTSDYDVEVALKGYPIYGYKKAFPEEDDGQK